MCVRIHTVGSHTTTISDDRRPRCCRGLAYTGTEVYVAEVMATFVRYFVAFLFLEGLYLRPDSGATNMQRDRATRFVRSACIRLHLRE